MQVRKIENVSYRSKVGAMAVNALGNDALITSCMDGIVTAYCMNSNANLESLTLTLIIRASQELVTESTLHHLIKLLGDKSMSISWIDFLNSVSSKDSIGLGLGLVDAHY